MNYKVRFIFFIILLMVVLHVIGSNIRKFTPLIKEMPQIPSFVGKKIYPMDANIMDTKSYGKMEKQKLNGLLQSLINTPLKENSKIIKAKPISKKVISPKLPEISIVDVLFQRPLINITFENEIFANPKLSYENQKIIASMYADMQTSNQQTLRDLNDIFGKSISTKAISIIADNELKLKTIAQETKTVPAYIKQQKQILQEQEREIFNLIKKSSSSAKIIATN